MHALTHTHKHTRTHTHTIRHSRTSEQDKSYVTRQNEDERRAHTNIISGNLVHGAHVNIISIIQKKKYISQIHKYSVERKTLNEVTVVTDLRPDGRTKL